MWTKRHGKPSVHICANGDGETRTRYGRVIGDIGYVGLRERQRRGTKKENDSISKDTRCQQDHRSQSVLSS